ncbi:flavodoxin [Aestuariibacter sp. AA17]|uniref:Flavodoxin n=1 Tax=Fluctibacter corallii TaxID=2984329 RepID=A0ABT3A8G6_9ALTE|nr:flavodoxin [Aestuariibacter sp. AA17]MCV2884980.1 flavodoxin [Aestuariibacter sp. AA17]
MSDLSIFVGSVYGNAQNVAEEVKAMIEAKGHSATVFTDPTLDDFKASRAVLMISSTTGQGDIPPNLEFFVADLKDAFPLMEQKPFAVVAMGDSSYGDTYCGAGKRIYELLIELQGKPVDDLLEIDAIETLEPEKDVVPWVEARLHAFAIS